MAPWADIARRAPKFALALGAALVAPCCAGDANTLTGSLDEITPLAFTSVAVSADADVLVVEYDGPQSAPVVDGGVASTDVIFKLGVKIEGLTLTKGTDIDLTTNVSNGTPRTSCTRSVGQDPRRQLPPVERGDLILDSDVSIGGTASGHFDILFSEGGDVGEGRTVNGSYSGKVADANAENQP